MNKKGIFLTGASALLLASCSGNNESWTSAEKTLINDPDSVMRVLTIDDHADSLILRQKCTRLTVKDLQSPEYALLAQKMIATVTSPEQDGVGIAGPQVGITRRVVAVQRFDKAGEPFEVYANVSVTARRGEKELGPEGCLSIPGRRGDVLRYRDIDITYTSLNSLKDTTETVTGYTAVIFQHECDHLDGILYIDYSL